MVTVLRGEVRERSGKGAARAVRRAGKIPAIVYGGKEPPLKIAIDAKQLLHAMQQPRFFSTVLDIDLGDRIEHVLPREAQLHPVTDRPLHVDFVRAGAGARVTVAVPVRFVNEAECPGLKRGGVLNVVRREIELVCPADAIPSEIVADLKGFDIGDSIHIRHVALPEGVRPRSTERDFTIASIVPPTVAEAPPAGQQAPA
ncbi:MAG: 50S ribosomal protein L25/general stress protein Ctc [Geminicoccaceae bacterium]|nr:50S ribosomal protein L25/general stress protein Ctc [Geminicoccaceae bacterium]MCX7629440.1 50S ribosomal protein L25/general stress protein Ctc [Geminicoccaceae bacterium]MDW8341121.1 50S ribosomal protein L25/general stress protein Ctc [Geminicoccaceae bacterium]